MLRRDVLGLGLMGIVPPAPAIGPRKPHLSVDAALDAELAAIAGDPACPLASLSVVTIRAGVIHYEKQWGIAVSAMASRPACRPMRRRCFASHRCRSW